MCQSISLRNGARPDTSTVSLDCSGLAHCAPLADIDADENEVYHYAAGYFRVYDVLPKMGGMTVHSYGAALTVLIFQYLLRFGNEGRTKNDV